MKPREILQSEVEAIIGLEEGHFADLKSKDISPSKITRTISAFANADGGEIFIGIEDEPRQWRGFSNFEENAITGLSNLGQLVSIILLCAHLLFQDTKPH